MSKLDEMLDEPDLCLTLDAACMWDLGMRSPLASTETLEKTDFEFEAICNWFGFRKVLDLIKRASASAIRKLIATALSDQRSWAADTSGSVHNERQWSSLLVMLPNVTRSVPGLHKSWQQFPTNR